MTLAEQLEAKNNPEGDPRCVKCRFIIRSYEKSYEGHCSVCAGRSSFVISPAASKRLRDEFEARMK